MRPKMMNRRMQAVLDLMPVEEAYQELAEWWKEWSKLERVDEVEIYSQLPKGVY